MSKQSIDYCFNHSIVTKFTQVFSPLPLCMNNWVEEKAHIIYALFFIFEGDAVDCGVAKPLEFYIQICLLIAFGHFCY